MSSNNDKKHLGYELLALVLFLGGAFLAVSGVMSLGAEGEAGNASTAAVDGLIAALGLVPFLVATVAAAALGAVLFLRPAPTPLTGPLALLVGGTLSASLLLGALGGWGGGLGGALPGATGAVLGGILGALVAFVVAVGTCWVAIGAPLPRKTRNVDQENPVVAALREVDEDGVSAAEAEALFPDPVPLAAAPGVREHEQRTRGELPDGVQVLDPDHAAAEPEDHPAPEAVPQGAAGGEGLAEPAGADLAEAGAAEPVAPVTGDDEGLHDGVWVRPHATEDLSDVRPLDGGSRLRPSWESASADEPEDPAAIAEDGEAFDEFEVDEVPAKDDAPAGAAFLEEEVDEDEEPEVAELDEDVEEEDEAAELEDEELDELEEAAELEDEEELEEDEELVAEAEEVDEDADLEEVAELEEDEELVAEVDEREGPAAGVEPDDSDPLGVFDESEEAELEEDDEAVDDAGPARPSWEQPGLFDAQDEELVAEAEEVDEDEELEEAAELEEDEELVAEAEEVDEDEELEEAAVLEEDEELVAEAEEVDEDEDLEEAAELEDDEELVAEAEEVDEDEELEEAAELENDEELVAEAEEVDEDEDLEEAAELEEDEDLAAEASVEPIVELEPAARVEELELEPEPEAPAEPEPVVELDRAELLFRCGKHFLDEGRVAVSMLQRHFDMSFKEATGVLDELQAMGLIGPYLGGQHREILLSLEEWEELAAAT